MRTCPNTFPCSFHSSSNFPVGLGLKIECESTAVREAVNRSAGILKNFANFTGKQQCQSLFFNKVPGCGLLLYQKRYSSTRVFL